MDLLDPVIAEWVSMILRWLHVVAGIAWIGSSFYFIHLDLSLRKPEGTPAGIQGEAWQVHGGGFYHMVKYLVAPTRLPDHLTWFKWKPTRPGCPGSRSLLSFITSAPSCS